MGTEYGISRGLACKRYDFSGGRCGKEVCMEEVDYQSIGMGEAAFSENLHRSGIS